MQAAVLSLPDVLTLREASGVLKRLLAKVAAQPAGARVRVSAAALRKFDSSALAVLLECRRAALGSGRSFSVEQLPADLQGLAGVYGVAILVSDSA